MIVRCSGCGATVSEWAARCTQCGTAVELSIAEAEPDPTAGDGPTVIGGVLISDGAPDPDTAIWSRQGSPLRPVWERTGLPIAPAPPADTLAPTPDDAEATLAEQQVEEPEPPSRRRRWLWAAVAAAAALAIAALVGAVVLPSSDPTAVLADRNAFDPIRHAPTEQWSAAASGDLYAAALSSDTLYAGFMDDQGAPNAVVAYDRTTGVPRWTTEIAGTLYGYVLLTANDDGVVISGGNDMSPSLYMLDRQTGEERWHLDGTWWMIGRRVGDYFAVVKDDGGPTPSEVYRVDTRTGATELLPGQLVGYVSTGLMTEQDGTLTAYDPDTLERTREWSLPRGELDGLELALQVGDHLVGVRRGKVVGIDPEGGTWSLDVNGGVDAGWLMPVARDRVLALSFDARTSMALIDLTGEPSILWSEQEDYLNPLTPTVIIGQRDAQAVLLRITDTGLQEVSELGSYEDVVQFGQSYDIVLVQDGDSLTGVRADGTTAWQTGLAADQVFPVDEGVVVVREGDLVLYT